MFFLLSVAWLIFTALAIFSMPWVAGISYAVISIAQPQYIWFWVFDSSFPVFKITAGIALLALGLKVLRGQVDFSAYKYKQNVALLLLCALFNLSSALTPYPNPAFDQMAAIIVDTMNIITLMYFVMLGLIDNEKALKWCVFGFMAFLAYYIYWANSAYLNQEWFRFVLGRLHGPVDSIYYDSNKFALLFVCGMPFFLFGIFYFKQLWVKIVLGALLGLMWHATFLTGSRGGLLALVVASLGCATIIKSKALNITGALLLFVAISTQAGLVLERSENTAKATQQEDREGALNPRLESWKAAIEIFKKYPLLGVGPYRFLSASSTHFPDKLTHVAHSTPLSIFAQMGVFGGLSYLYMCYAVYGRFKRARSLESAERSDTYWFIRNSTSTAMLGFFVGAIFLDLYIYEPFYFLLLLNLANEHVAQQRQQEEPPSENTQPRRSMPPFLRQSYRHSHRTGA